MAQTRLARRLLAPGHFAGVASGRERAIDARRCTVQLSNGRLYLDAAATPETSLLGHDRPSAAGIDGSALRQRLESLAPDYACIALLGRSDAVERLGRRLAISIEPNRRRRVELTNALCGDPGAEDWVVVAIENETLGRAGAWLASARWRRRPQFVILGRALALGRPFAALMAKKSIAEQLDLSGPPFEVATPLEAATASLAIAVIDSVGRDGLIEHGQHLANYLAQRLEAVCSQHPEITSLSIEGLAARIVLASSISPMLIRRRLCERGVLVGIDSQNRLIINPPLPMRLAEVDVITGALRAALVDEPGFGVLACCAGCEEMLAGFSCVET